MRGGCALALNSDECLPCKKHLGSKISPRIIFRKFWNCRIVAEIKLKKMDAMRASVQVENEMAAEVHGAVCVKKKQGTDNQPFASVLGHHPIIALADFTALLTFEEIHPNLFHRNRTMPSAAALAVADALAARLRESCTHVESGWIEEAAFQMHAFNLVFDDPAYSPEFKQIVKMSEILIRRTGH